jgi:hypothetical protein
MTVYIVYRRYLVPVYARWANEVRLIGTFEVTAETARGAKQRASANAAYQYGYSSSDHVYPGRPALVGKYRCRVAPSGRN